MYEIKRDCWIWIGEIVACLIIASYLLLNDYIIDTRAYSVAINLAYSYTAAVIFYFLQITIPDRRKRKKASKLLEPDIHRICETLATFLAFIDVVIDIKNNHINIHGMGEDGTVYYRFYRENSCSKEYRNILSYMKNFESQLKKNLVDIKAHDFYIYLKADIQNILNEIEMEKLSVIQSAAVFYNVSESFEGLSETIAKLNNYLSRLSKYDPRACKYHLELLSDEEKEKYISDIFKYQPVHSKIQKQVQKNMDIITSRR